MDYSKKKYNKNHSPNAVLQKLMKYCAYQERCHSEVRTKILSYKIYGADLEHIIVELIQQNFLNEERFARAYARGRFKLKSWGKNKIIQGLRQRKVTEYCISRGLEEIEDLEYDAVLKKVLTKKKSTLKVKPGYEMTQKLYQYGLQKGYSSADIKRILSQFVD